MKMKKTTFIYYVDISSDFAEDVNDYVTEKKEFLIKQLKDQYKEEFSLNLLGIIAIPIRGISRVEILDINI